MIGVRDIRVLTQTIANGKRKETELIFKVKLAWVVFINGDRGETEKRQRWLLLIQLNIVKAFFLYKVRIHPSISDKSFVKIILDW